MGCVKCYYIPCNKEETCTDRCQKLSCCTCCKCGLPLNQDTCEIYMGDTYCSSCLSKQPCCCDECQAQRKFCKICSSRSISVPCCDANFGCRTFARSRCPQRTRSCCLPPKVIPWPIPRETANFYNRNHTRPNIMDNCCTRYDKNCGCNETIDCCPAKCKKVSKRPLIVQSPPCYPCKESTQRDCNNNCCPTKDTNQCCSSPTRRKCEVKCCNPCPEPCRPQCNPCPDPCRPKCNPCIPRRKDPCRNFCRDPCQNPCPDPCRQNCNPCPDPCRPQCNQCPDPCRQCSPCRQTCNPCPDPCRPKCNPCSDPCRPQCNPCPDPCRPKCNPCPDPCPKPKCCCVAKEYKVCHRFCPPKPTVVKYDKCDDIYINKCGDPCFKIPPCCCKKCCQTKCEPCGLMAPEDVRKKLECLTQQPRRSYNVGCKKDGKLCPPSCTENGCSCYPCCRCRPCPYATPRCIRCKQKVYLAEQILVSNGVFHNNCFTCHCCNKQLDMINVYEGCGEVYCKRCYCDFFSVRYYGFVN